MRISPPPCEILGYKFIKKIALMLPPIRKKYEELNNLRSDKEKIRIQLESSLYENDNLRNQNNALNIQLGRYSFLIDKLDKLHDDVVESAFGGNQERKQYICDWPFSRVQIEQNGDVFTCCTTYLKQGKSDYSIGNIFENSFEEIWNSDKAKNSGTVFLMGILSIVLKNVLHSITHPCILQ